MKAYIITVKGNELSEQSAKKTFDSAKWAGLEPELFYGVNKYDANWYLHNLKLKVDNTDGVFTKVSYKEPTIACFISHFLLWKKSLEKRKTFVILEHDVTFYDKFNFTPEDEFDKVVNIGKPLWGTKWKSWEDEKWMFDLYYRTCKTENVSYIDEYADCDCEEHFLHGAHAYIITPRAAKKLINHYTENGIIPADNAINTNVVEIGDLVPFVCEQVREFSLVQRDHPVQEFPEGFLYGDNAWKDSCLPDESHIKKVMVFMCDGNLLDKVKPLIHNAKTKGEWDGDFVLMVPESINTDYFDNDKDNDLIIYKVPDLMDATIHFHKS